LQAGLEQRLVIVGSVKINEPPTHLFQSGQRGGATVDELAIGSGRGEGSLEDQLAGFAGFESPVIQKAVQRRSQACHVEDGLDGARVGSGAEGAPIGTAPQHQMERPEDNRLAGSGFPGDGAEAWLQVQGEVRYQRQILDP
jgi:hypothetical protein